MFLFKIGSFRLRSIQDPPPPSLYSPIGLLTDTTQGEAKREQKGIVDAVQTGQPLGLKRVKKDEGGRSAEENRKPTVPQNTKPGSVFRKEQDVSWGSCRETKFLLHQETSPTSPAGKENGTGPLRYSQPHASEEKGRYIRFQSRPFYYHISSILRFHHLQKVPLV